MNKMLILTDFSANSESAIRYGIHLSRIWNTHEITLLHTYEPPVLLEPDPANGFIPAGAPNAINYAIFEDQSRALEKSNTEEMLQLKTRIESTFNIPDLKTITTEGFLGDVANDLITREAIDIVIMGISDKSKLEKVFIGSNAIKAIEGIDCPLLIIPGNDLPPVSPDVHIALASDLRPLNQRTIDQLNKIAGSFASIRLSIVTVNTDRERASNSSKVNTLKDQLAAYNPSVHFQKANNIEEGVHDFVNENAVNILLFIHQRRSFIARLFHTSVGKQITWNSTVPVLRLKD